MDISESKAHNVINRLEVRKDLRDESAWVLTSAGRFSRMCKNSQITKSELKSRIDMIKSHAESFKQYNRWLLFKIFQYINLFL